MDLKITPHIKKYMWILKSATYIAHICSQAHLERSHEPAPFDSLSDCSKNINASAEALWTLYVLKLVLWGFLYMTMINECHVEHCKQAGGFSKQQPPRTEHIRILTLVFLKFKFNKDQKSKHNYSVFLTYHCADRTADRTAHSSMICGSPQHWRKRGHTVYLCSL